MNSANETTAQKTILSGSTTSGNLILRNEIGAVSNWKVIQQNCLP